MGSIIRYKAPAGVSFEDISVGGIRGKYTPTGHANLYCRLSALELSTITKDGSNLVSSWLDTVASASFAGSGGGRPTYDEDGWDGTRPCITFDGALSGNILTNAGTGLFRDNMTVLIAAIRQTSNNDASTGGRPILTMGSDTGDKFFTFGGSRLASDAAQTQLLVSAAGTGAVTATTTGFDIGEPHVLALTVSGADATGGAVDDGTPAVGALGTSTASATDIGGHSGNNARRLGCKIAEILWFNTVLTGDDLARNIAYLAWQWGMEANLAPTNPYYEEGPVAA